MNSVSSFLDRRSLIWRTCPPGISRTGGQEVLFPGSICVYRVATPFLCGRNLEQNLFSDIIPLAGLHDLKELELVSNQIVDIKPLVDNTGLDGGEIVYLSSNPLSNTSITVYIPQLKANGVDVRWE